jgi:hypothetical protein
MHYDFFDVKRLEQSSTRLETMTVDVLPVEKALRRPSRLHATRRSDALEIAELFL